MATFTSIFLTVMIFVAASSAAPNNKKLSLKIPDECKGKDICAIKPEGYDELQDLITSLLTPTIIAQNMGDRIGEPTEELSPDTDWHNCPSRKKTEEPLWTPVSSDNSGADYIIQHKLIRQPIEMVTCANDKIDTGSSKQCFQHLGLDAFGMKTSCQSSSANRSLLVLDYKTQKLTKKSYPVPCCCSCQIIKL